MLKIDFCLQCGEIPIFCMLCVCFVFVFVEQIGPGSRARAKRNVCASFVFVFVNTLDRPKFIQQKYEMGCHRSQSWWKLQDLH